MLADQLDRAVEFGADLGGVGPVEQGVGVGVRSDGDESGGRSVAQTRPARGRCAPRERFAAVDEVGRRIQRGGDAELDQRRHDDVAEVVGAVVEGDHDRPLRQVRSPVGSLPNRIAAAVSRSITV